MAHFFIEGGRPLFGNVRIQGAKNAALPILAATVLTEGIHEIHNVPQLSDIEGMSRILGALGVKVTRDGNTVRLDTTMIHSSYIPEKLMQQMRSSIFLMGPLLARLKEVCVTHPGGCAIGKRPIDLHLEGLRLLGAEVVEKDGMIQCSAKRLTGRRICFDLPSVGATENVMMAAVRAEGVTVIKNAAREPEIVDLQAFLNQMGAKIDGAGTSEIVIHGVRHLTPASHHIIPDRIVTGTLAAAAVATGGEVTLTHTVPDHLTRVLDLLRQAGAIVEREKDVLKVSGTRLLQGVGRIVTAPYPGFPTDMQPQMMAVLASAEGTSTMEERIFDGRLNHVQELNRMGAALTVDRQEVHIHGVPGLEGADVQATDLRAGAALVIAGLSAAGTTRVSGVEHIERGYEQLDHILRQLGGNIVRIPSEVSCH